MYVPFPFPSFPLLSPPFILEDVQPNIVINIYTKTTTDLAPKHPIVFCHGLLGFDSVTIGPSIAPLEVTHWRGIKEALEAIGAEVLITRVPATSSPFDRAKVLEQRIEEVYPGRAVHLIGSFLFFPFVWGLGSIN